MASPWRESCPATARRIAPMPGATRSARSTSNPSGPGRTGPNKKIERLHRTLEDGWACARLYESNEERTLALPNWLHFYDHHRAHSDIGGQSPVTRPTTPLDITASPCFLPRLGRVVQRGGDYRRVARTWSAVPPHPFDRALTHPLLRSKHLQVRESLGGSEHLVHRVELRQVALVAGPAQCFGHLESR